MNQDIHQPAFIKADASYKTEKNRQPPSSPKQVRRFGWTRFIELTILLSVVIGVIWLISKIVTPQVVTAVSVITVFLILRFIVRIILKNRTFHTDNSRISQSACNDRPFVCP